jgi:hypothetical protein
MKQTVFCQVCQMDIPVPMGAKVYIKPSCKENDKL